MSTDLSLNQEMLAAAAAAVVPLFVDDSDAGFDGWIVFERDLRTRFRTTPLGQLTELGDVDSFGVQVVAALLTRELEPAFDELLQSRGSYGAGIRKGTLLQGLCRSIEARVRGSDALGAGGPLTDVLVDRTPSRLGDGVVLTLKSPARNFLLLKGHLSDDVARVAYFVHRPVSLLEVILPADQLTMARMLVTDRTAVHRNLIRWGMDRVGPDRLGMKMLFTGPPGTGKSLLARALASHLDAPLLVVKCDDMPEQGADRVLRDLFAEAKLRAAVVLFDECELLFGEDSKHKGTALLALDHHADGVSLLASNRPERLARALDRRMALHLRFERPDPLARRQIWEIHLPQDAPLGSDVDLDVLADRYELSGGRSTTPPWWLRRWRR